MSNSIHLKKGKKSKEVDFFSAFITAVQNNKDTILNSKECVEKIKKMKLEKEEKEKPKPISMQNFAKPLNKSRDKVLKYIQEEKEEQQKEIDKLVNEQKEKNKIIFGSQSKKEQTSQENSKTQPIQVTTQIQNNDPDTASAQSLKNGSKDPQTCQGDSKNDQPTQEPKKKKKLLDILNYCRNYLESNDIMLNEYIKFDPFQTKPFSTPYASEFLDAVKFGHYDAVVDALNNSEKYLFVFDYFKQTAYHWAAKLGNIKMLQLLIAKGKYVNQYDNKKRTPLFLAALNNQYECCQLLINNHGNCFMEDIEGRRPLDIATEPKIKVLLSDVMDNKYSNPEIRRKITLLLKTREDNIARKKAEENLIKGAEEKAKREENMKNRDIIELE